MLLRICAYLLSGVGVMVAVRLAGGFPRAAEALWPHPLPASAAPSARLEARAAASGLFPRAHPRAVELTEEADRFPRRGARPSSPRSRRRPRTPPARRPWSAERLKVNADPRFARVVLARACPS